MHYFKVSKLRGIIFKTKEGLYSKGEVGLLSTVYHFSSEPTAYGDVVKRTNLVRYAQYMIFRKRFPISYRPERKGLRCDVRIGVILADSGSPTKYLFRRKICLRGGMFGTRCCLAVD